jgi:hypothetical protein
MTEAVQVNLDQTYGYRLEESLSSAATKVEVLNFAVNGYSPLQELLQFRREGPRFNADLVILAVFLDNDIADCHPDLRISQTGIPFAAVADGSLRWDYSRAERSFAEYHSQPMYTVRNYSAIYRCLTNRLRRMGDVNMAQMGGGTTTSIPTRYQVYLKTPPPRWDDAWTTCEHALLAFADEAHRQEAQLVLLSVPAGQIVNPLAWQDSLSAHPQMSSATWDLDQPERRLADFAERYHLPLIRPTEQFRRAGSDPPLFFGHRGHLTPAGHEIMTQAVAAYLTEHRLVPTKIGSGNRP